MITIETFPVGWFECNCTLLFDQASKRAIVIDPGADFEIIEEKLAALGATVDAIVHTHTHIDHVGATAAVQRKHGARACIHEGDRFLYDLLPDQAAMFEMDVPELAELEDTLHDGTSLRTGEIELGVIHTPGHTPGSVMFVVNTDDGMRIFSGDTLFRGKIGRTDLWGGDGALIRKSLHDKILTLPENAIVVPGHGPNTTIGEERVKNPFLQR